MTKAELNDEIDKRIESIKNITLTLVDVIGDLDEQRASDKRDWERRISTLEHEFARIISK